MGRGADQNSAVAETRPRAEPEPPLSLAHVSSHPQRQDSSDQQMADLLSAAVHLGRSNAAGWLHDRYFGGKPVPPTRFGLESGALAVSARGLAEQLQDVRRIAVHIGCYDAEQWIRDTLNRDAGRPVFAADAIE